MSKEIREAFEHSIYHQYSTEEFAKIESGNLDDLRLIPKQEFFKMKTGGGYVLEPLNFAWSGYTLGIRDVLESQNVVADYQPLM